MKRKGFTVEVNLKAYGYDGYTVECTYRYDKKKEKYLLRMGLKPKHTDHRIKIEFQEIDTQYISGTRETIEDNIYRIIEYAAYHDTLFAECIAQYEYVCKCFDVGNEILEKERLNEINNGN